MIGLTALLLTASACAAQHAPAEPLAARGILLGLSQRSLTELERVDLRTDEGEVITFEIEGDVGLTPSHAREHMTFVEPVTVFYREGSTGKVAYLIVD